MSKVTFKGGTFLSTTAAVTGSFRAITAVSGSVIVASAEFVDGSAISTMPIPSGTTLDVKIKQIKLTSGGVFLYY